MSGQRRHCRADELRVGTVISLGYAVAPIAELRRTGQRITLRIEGDSLWHTRQPDDAVYLEPAEHLIPLLAARRR